LKNYLNAYINSYPDFPNKGILFHDLLPILLNPEIFKILIENMASKEIFCNSEAIIGIESRGVIFGTALALKLSKPLILARKPGKLPGILIQKSYKLEYGENTLSIQKNSIKLYDNFAIVDDLLATGGTANCVYQLIKESGKNIIGLSVVAELNELKAKDELSFPVYSEILL
tara:strand:- start:957 stop:1472 length:516 start_codon:yes stop_codon:yes gene_type:complete